MMGLNRKQSALALGSLVVIAASMCWLSINFFRSKFNKKLHQGIGHVMAEETEKLLNGKGKVVVIIQDPKVSPVFEAQLRAFEKVLKRKGGISLAETVLVRAGARQKVGPGMGLS